MSPEVNDHVSLQWPRGLWDSNRWFLENKFRTRLVELHPLRLIQSNSYDLNFFQLFFLIFSPCITQNQNQFNMEKGQENHNYILIIIFIYFLSNKAPWPAGYVSIGGEFSLNKVVIGGLIVISNLDGLFPRAFLDWKFNFRPCCGWVLDRIWC
jgi:hypothetical protein